MAAFNPCWVMNLNEYIYIYIFVFSTCIFVYIYICIYVIIGITVITYINYGNPCQANLKWTPFVSISCLLVQDGQISTAN